MNQGVRQSISVLGLVQTLSTLEGAGVRGGGGQPPEARDFTRSCVDLGLRVNLFFEATHFRHSPGIPLGGTKTSMAMGLARAPGNGISFW